MQINLEKKRQGDVAKKKKKKISIRGLMMIK